ncbi:hypothetical protein [Sphingobium sp.]|uniref:hypothetical protein n=1 Tax=Sphingobium sp. TaxID=1912891 RepID=UPI0028BD5592|nr:hypothetical protein [Sphingobium sp.]
MLDRLAGLLERALNSQATATKPVQVLIARLGALAQDSELREDAARLLLDEARIADGEIPADPRAFSARLARMIGGAIS